MGKHSSRSEGRDPSLQNGRLNHSLRPAEAVDQLVKMDLKDAYLTVPVHPDHQLGGTVLCQWTELAKELWTWALDRDIALSAQHIPGVSRHHIVDIESRDGSDWILYPRIFQANKEAFRPLDQTWGQVHLKVLK